MKYSYTWLKELSGTEKTAQEVAELLIVHAFEVEEVLEQGAGLEHVVVGEVLSTEKHPDADKLNVATVQVGTEELQIVCGAPNLEAGQKVAVALVGAKLPTADGKGFKIKKSKIRGVESHGMICAEDELGLGRDHDGIMVLAEDAPVGDAFAAYYGLNDTILDIDVLPNRGHDAISHYGMAREIAALEGRALAVPPVDVPTAVEGVAVEIATPACARYSAMVFDHVTIGPSPAWMQARLRAAGLQSINNVVDITNYVMLLTGQPTHAFDAAMIPEKRIVVRQAQAGEACTLLDNTVLTLSTDDIVITDGAKPIALAGIMGGKGSAIADDTTRVIFEVANFDAMHVRRSKTAHGLQTDAAYRFERDIDPNMVAHAIAVAQELFVEHAGAESVAFSDEYPEPEAPWSVVLEHSALTRLLGVEIASERVGEILTALGCAVQIKKDRFLCTIPTWRRDLHTAADLVEEVGRVYGYGTITPMPLHEQITAPERNTHRAFEWLVKDVLVAEGLHETKGYSFYSETDAETLGQSAAAHVALMNPMSEEQALMRRTLLAGLLRAAATNTAHTQEQGLFDIGRVYEPQDEGLPQECLVLSCAITSRGTAGEQFYELKGIVDRLCRALGITGVAYTTGMVDDPTAPTLHPSRQATLRLPSGAVIGVIGETTKKQQKYFGIKHARTAVCELHFEILLAARDVDMSFAPIGRYPLVGRDLSMRVGARTRVADVERVIYDAGSALLQDVDLFDLYEDGDSEERSMAFHLFFGSAERTLEAAEVDAVVAEMIAALEKEDGVEVRR